MTSSATIPAGDLVLVVPCYNESRRLDLDAVREAARSQPRIRFLFVDDGSTDDTAAVLEALCATDPRRLRWTRLAQNSGKAEAVRTGVLQAIDEAIAGATDQATHQEPRFVGYWDADFSTPLPVVADFLAALDANPALIGVLGSRIRRLGARVERRPLRHYVGRIFATLASLILGIAVYDTQCGAKMFRVNETLKHVFAEPFLSPWIFDVELLARLCGAYAPEPLTDRLYELPLPSWRDVAGSKLTTTRGALAFLDLIRIYRAYR